MCDQLVSMGSTRVRFLHSYLDQMLQLGVRRLVAYQSWQIPDRQIFSFSYLWFICNPTELKQNRITQLALQHVKEGRRTFVHYLETRLLRRKHLDELTPIHMHFHHALPKLRKLGAQLWPIFSM